MSDTTTTDPAATVAATVESNAAHNANSASTSGHSERMAAWAAVEKEMGPVDFTAPLLEVREDVKTAIDAAGIETEEGREGESAEVEGTEVEETEEEAKASAAKRERAPDGKFKGKEKDKDKGKDAKPETKVAPTKSPEERTALQALIDDRRKLRERHERNEQELLGKVQARENAISARAQKLDPLARAASAAEAGDFDGFAKGLGEYLGTEELKDWSTLNAQILHAMQAPGYKQLREQRRELDAFKKQQEQEKEAARQYQAQQQQAQAVAEWKRDLAQELESDEDSALANLLVARPGVADALVGMQNHHYHSTRGDVLNSRSAGEQFLRNVFSDFKFWRDYASEHSESPLVQELLEDIGEGLIEKSSTSAKAPAPGAVKRKAEKYEGASQEPKTNPAKQANGALKVPVAKKPQVQLSQTSAPSAPRQLTDKEIKEQAVRRMNEEWAHLRSA